MEIVEQTGRQSTWDWNPRKAGAFRVKVTIRDDSGGSVDSGWSRPYIVLPQLTRAMPIALLPGENLSGERAPVAMAVQRLRASLEQNGFRLIDEEIVETFMHHERIRIASGLSRGESRALKEATGAEAILVTSLGTYQEGPPPAVSLFCRLVSSGDEPEILWMESVTRSGEDEVGLLGIGRIQEAGVLLDGIIDHLTGSLATSLPGAPVLDVLDAVPCDPKGARETETPDGDGACTAPDFQWSAAFAGGGESGEPSLPEEGDARYRPRSVFRSPLLDLHRRYSVAVIPFVNLSEQKNAGQLMALHFVEEIARIDGLRVIDPGRVREEMLRYRTVIPWGPSLSTADLLSSDRSLGIDLLLSGTVFAYGGGPKVEFDVTVIETSSREVVWTSRSYNQGGEGVYFLDYGRVYTAHRLAADMVRAALLQMRR